MSYGRFYEPKTKRSFISQRAARYLQGTERGQKYLLSLAARASERLRRTGRGRPSARWDIRRLVPFGRDNWRRLGWFAAQLGLSAGQLAAMLVEDGLARLEHEPPASAPPATEGKPAR